jgi:hypothetical protein
MSASTIPFASYYQPGSTLTAVFNDTVCRFKSKSADPMGRWSQVSLTGRKGRVIHFVTVYQVVKTPTIGPFTAYQQQVASLRLSNRSQSLRQAFISDLSQYLRELHTPTSEFVMMGDLNEVVGLERSGFQKITNEFDLVDILAHYHSIESEVPTYARGNTRLDYVFCSQNILPSVKRCGFLPFNEHVFSDHRGFFVDWNESELFGSESPAMAAKTYRRLQSNNIQAKGGYLLRLDKYCSYHKIYQRFATLSDTKTPVWDDIEKLDQDNTWGMLHAEKHCRYLGKDSWSPPLKQARMQDEIFKLLLSTARTKRDYSNRITKLIGQYENEIVLPEMTEDQIPIIQVSLRRA